MTTVAVVVVVNADPPVPTIGWSIYVIVVLAVLLLVAVGVIIALIVWRRKVTSLGSVDKKSAREQAGAQASGGGKHEYASVVPVGANAEYASAASVGADAESAAPVWVVYASTQV